MSDHELPFLYSFGATLLSLASVPQVPLPFHKFHVRSTSSTSVPQVPLPLVSLETTAIGKKLYEEALGDGLCVEAMPLSLMMKRMRLKAIWRAALDP